MTDRTPRFALPLLEAGQAQKEVLHNEAIVALEALAQPIVETIGDAAPPESPAEGMAWIVGSSPGGAWAGHPGALASWTAGGWRFVAPVDGMAVFVKATRLVARYGAGAWLSGEMSVARVLVGTDQVVGARRPAIAAPAGGAVVDAEARAAIMLLLGTMRAHGLIAT